MISTASDLPELRPASSGPRVFISGRHDEVFDFFEAFTGGIIVVSAKPIEHHWAWREWNQERMSAWVNLDATGATVMDPTRYRHLTMYHMAVDALPAELVDTMDDIKELATLRPGWNGYDVAAPKNESIRQASKWIREMYEDVRRMRAPWHNPHVTADADGDVIFEWWNDGKGLVVYVSEEGATYITDWGTNMETEMEDGEATTPEVRRKLWEWLIS